MLVITDHDTTVLQYPQWTGLRFTGLDLHFLAANS